MERNADMTYAFTFLWCAMDICFAHLFLREFSEARRSTRQIGLTLAAIWLLCGLFSCFIPHSAASYFPYLLSVTFILLGIYDEQGLKGLCLLAFAFLVPFAADITACSVAEALGGYRLAVTLGKAAAILFAVLLSRYRASHKRRSISESAEALLLRQHMEMQQESMASLEQNYRLQRKSTHEFEHHLGVLRNLLSQGESSAAIDYLNRLKKDRSIHSISISSGNPVVDVILNQKYSWALENEIKMQIRVNDLSAIDTPADSLAVILTNLLDNAIEACLRIDGYREIFCTVLENDGLYISIRNTSPSVNIVDGKIPTSKEDSLSHGFGLLSVTYVLDKLGAEYTYGYSDGYFHFTAEIS